jgi:hypothetical protein
MDDSVLLLVPVLTLAVVLLFGFTGCTLNTEGTGADVPDDGTGEGPPPDGDEGPTGPPQSPPTYKDLITEEGYLVAWWRLSEGAVAATAIDSAMKYPDLDGTYSGNPDLSQSGPLSADTCADFTGAQYVDVAYSPALNPPEFSIEAWVNPELQASGTQPEVLLSSRVRVQTEPYGFALLMDLDPANPRWFARVLGGASGATDLEAPLGSPVRADGWRHIVVTYRAGTNPLDHDAQSEAQVLRLYVDGIPQAPDPNNPGTDYIANVPYTPLPMQSRPLRIAAWNDNTPADHFLYGRLDEVALYNGALMKERIGKHFDAAV